ncbi:hypothetical protein [Streptomyces sp. NPDC059786]|uniref:hypothetical protein n=1 Tax=Streptomyces sp. NPDC059786 TaxID=3346946 RepID=UPI0036548FE1
MAAPPPAPAPKPSPPKPKPKPSPSKASPKPVSYPPYRITTRKHPRRTGPPLVSLTLLITVPALLAVAALRPR